MVVLLAIQYLHGTFCRKFCIYNIPENHNVQANKSPFNCSGKKIKIRVSLILVAQNSLIKSGLLQFIQILGYVRRYFICLKNFRHHLGKFITNMWQMMLFTSFEDFNFSSIHRDSIVSVRNCYPSFRAYFYKKGI